MKRWRGEEAKVKNEKWKRRRKELERDGESRSITTGNLVLPFSSFLSRLPFLLPLFLPSSLHSLTIISHHPPSFLSFLRLFDFSFEWVSVLKCLSLPLIISLSLLVPSSLSLSLLLYFFPSTSKFPFLLNNILIYDCHHLNL